MNNSVTTGVPCTTKSGEVQLLETIYWIALNYLYYVATVIGLPGNIMSFLITMRSDNRRISTSVYMAALAVVDTMTFLTGDTIAVVFESDPVRNFLGGNIGKFLEVIWYLEYSFAISSGFFLMEMSVDRLIVVRFPMAAGRICTTARAKVTVFMTLVLIFGLNSNVLFVYKYNFDESTGVESVQPDVKGNPALEMFGSMFQLFFGTLIPFAVIMFMNIWIIITVKRASHKHKQMTGSSAPSDAKRKQETSHLTRMLILVSSAYVVCSIPLRLYEMLFDLPALKEIWDFGQVVWFMRYKVGYIILADIWILNFGVNFYLYCIGGKKFRNDAVNILKVCFMCKEKKHDDISACTQSVKRNT
ncbi:G-protein coupled receptor 183-like [Lineus longissimus]|uniref:G-protein coupled receptor 183-like n=1 Tax=Lineus longissimus TaxID=88925 RepID=UPI00315D2BE0